MRIQHNIMAVNAYRNYNNNTGALSKNLEKLSSGYRINRAGDDAAGLGISEKMRAQITGLSAAQKNVKDGVSLVKTAEGAMQEIQDMLGRMDYLATQSANGTYQDEVDRANLQKEVQSLKKEIDRIAESANYNGIKLLNGSLKEETVENAGAAAVAMRLRGGAAAEGTDEGDGINALMRSRLVSRATPAVPAKKAVFTFDFNALAGTYNRGDSIQIALGDGEFNKKTIMFWPTAQSGVGDWPSGYARTGEDLAYMVSQKLQSEYEMDGETFVLSRSGSVLTLEQKNAPTDESQLIEAANATFSVEVRRVKPSEIAGEPKVNAAFGDKAEINAPTKKDFEFRDQTYTVKGQIIIEDLDPHKLVDEMRRKGKKGETPPGFYMDNQFKVLYDAGVGGYFIGTTYDGQITDVAKVTDESGNILSGDSIFPKSGETVILDFGEVGRIKLVADQPGVDFQASDFRGGGGGSLWVLTPAASANGGSIKFEITDEQRRRLADHADMLAVSSPDPYQTTLPADITMRWNNDHFELISKGANGVDDVVIARSNTRSVDSTDPISFYTAVNDPSTLVATATMEKTTPDAIAATAFEDGVTTGLQFREPDYDDRTVTTHSAQFTAGALEIPEIPDPPGPDEPDPPGPGPDDPDPPGPGPGPDDPDPPGPGPGPDDPDPPNPPVDPDDPNKPGTRGGKGLILQIGDTSQDYDRMHVFIGDMHTDAMGAGKATLDGREVEITDTVADIDIGTQSGAQDAIAVIKNAINYVSGVRGDLGAYQNRLEHTANNLSVMAENIQDAESTIRDTDVAEEMMGYVKNNILIQSAQAMLAQANQVPQGVLSLLAG